MASNSPPSAQLHSGTVARVVLLDDDGKRTGAGDRIWFSYGIPPVRAEARIVQMGNSLIAFIQGHTPSRAFLRGLRRHVGCWYKIERK
jgi:hypothetical protein